MNKSCVRRLPGSRHGGGPVCWAPRLAGKGQLWTPSCRVSPPLSRAGAQQDRRWLWNEQWLSQAEGSHYSEVVSAPAPEPGQSPGLGVSPTPTLLSHIRSRSWQGHTCSAAPGRGVCQDGQTHPGRGLECAAHIGTDATAPAHMWVPSEIGPLSSPHMGPHTHTEAYGRHDTHRPAHAPQQPPSLSLGEGALLPIWALYGLLSQEKYLGA